VITLLVIGYFIYICVGFSLLAYLADKYLDDDKVCVSCILYLSIMLWACMPFTLMIDLRG